VEDEEAEGSSLSDFARQAASLDHLSHGRLTLGIGLGDKDRCNYEKFGESVDNRILAEKLQSLDIITGLWIEAWEPQSQVPWAISRSDESNVAAGIALPQYGTIASPETILRVAEEAEKIGLSSLWTSDRMLLPTKPKETFDGDPWPEIFATVYDPIEMLTFAAARTRKVKLGTSVMSALFQNPVTLARRFATLDRLSDGRAIAGIGQGDFRDEFEAANIPLKRRGRGFEEFARAMRGLGPRPSQLHRRLL
jgi:alkanesulfonate monooxygenase SsuD/methylene tetrahydromethanopterin reductase-like flavin-dependent oxidoreductase (luciferase family)